MSMFCTNCGREIADGIAFCTECGTPAPTESFDSQARAAPEKTPSAGGDAPMRETPKVTPPPAYQQPVYAQPAVMQDVKAKGGRYGVLSTGAFFGLIFLFAIPVAGWIACIVMAFAAKNENIKHFARAMLIWLIIAAVLCVAMYFLFAWIGDAIRDYINDATGGQFGSLADILELQ